MPPLPDCGWTNSEFTDYLYHLIDANMSDIGLIPFGIRQLISISMSFCQVYISKLLHILFELAYYLQLCVPATAVGRFCTYSVCIYGGVLYRLLHAVW